MLRFLPARRILLNSWKNIPRSCPKGLRWNHNVASDVSPIEQLVLDNIKLAGPVSFAKYMQLCLSHHSHGYYMNPNNAVFGTSGDFITSPEISQVFGELVGIWFVTQWANSGTPPSVRLVELGPGRGTLMDDVLRVVSKFLPSKTLSAVHLVETSQALRSIQEAKLQQNPDHGTFDVQWHNAINEIPYDPTAYTMLVAHEFFDALPIHIIRKTEDTWKEVMIDSSAPSTIQQAEGSSSSSTATSTNDAQIPEGRLRRVLNPLPSAVSTLLGNSSSRFRNLSNGSTIEVSPTSFRIAHQIGRLLSASPEDALQKALESRGSSSEAPTQSSETSATKGVGGCGLIIDYGADHAFEDSFRAFKEHKIVDVFHRPGECDLTANVDFAYIKEAMAGLVESHGPISQADFLERMAIRSRVEALVRNAPSEERRNVILDAAKRLVDRNGMGNEYKILGITSGGVTRAETTRQVIWPFVRQEQESRDDEAGKPQITADN